MASIAHNVLKAVRRLGLGTGPPGPHTPTGCAQSLQPRDSGEPSVGLHYPILALRGASGCTLVENQSCT